MTLKLTTSSQYYIGLMSGTSLDGVDTALVEFSDQQLKLVASHTHPIPSSLRKQLIDSIQPDWKGSLSKIGILNQKLGHLFADASNHLINTNNINTNRIKAIGSHGQTLWHQPTGDYPFSMQLGDGNFIAEKTGITTIADFRGRDIAAGGQGAPLVPAFHKAYFSHQSKYRVLLNIGGIANITLLPPINSSDSAMGYDTGPGNGLIDAWIFKHLNKSYDRNGDWANSGKVLTTVLNTLLEDDYFSLPPPKSTGKEAFNLSWLQTRLTDLTEHNSQNIQATLTELTAQSIAKEILRNAPYCHDLFICGGGIHNRFLIKRLKHHLPKITINSTKTLGVDPDWMEAMAFAWLAKQTIEGLSSNLPSATGAQGNRILGAIFSK